MARVSAVIQALGLKVREEVSLAAREHDESAGRPQSAALGGAARGRLGVAAAWCACLPRATQNDARRADARFQVFETV